MPWGWECRARLIKQVPPKPTECRGEHHETTPAPNTYEAPQIFCGPGYDKIKRAPAYTFGHRTALISEKQCPNARMFNVHGLSNKGPHKITHGLMLPYIEPLAEGTKTPGPAVYKPPISIMYKKPPAYTMQPAAKPPYQPWDMWTPPANMYHPPVPGKKEPAYTLGYLTRETKQAVMPGPGEHDPNFNYIKKKKPAYSFGAPYKQTKLPKIPAPNTYCEKKFMVTKRTIPAPSFGIRHSPFLGQSEVYFKSSKLDLIK